MSFISVTLEFTLFPLVKNNFRFLGEVHDDSSLPLPPAVPSSEKTDQGVTCIINTQWAKTSILLAKKFFWFFNSTADMMLFGGFENDFEYFEFLAHCATAAVIMATLVAQRLMRKLMVCCQTNLRIKGPSRRDHVLVTAAPPPWREWLKFKTESGGPAVPRYRVSSTTCHPKDQHLQIIIRKDIVIER